jgi:hypothetical protein
VSEPDITIFEEDIETIDLICRTIYLKNGHNHESAAALTQALFLLREQRERAFVPLFIDHMDLEIGMWIMEGQYRNQCIINVNKNPKSGSTHVQFLSGVKASLYGNSDKIFVRGINGVPYINRMKTNG